MVLLMEMDRLVDLVLSVTEHVEISGPWAFTASLSRVFSVIKQSLKIDLSTLCLEPSGDTLETLLCSLCFDYASKKSRTLC